MQSAIFIWQSKVVRFPICTFANFILQKRKILIILMNHSINSYNPIQKVKTTLNDGRLFGSKSRKI